jgi:hypothetical protein
MLVFFCFGGFVFVLFLFCFCCFCFVFDHFLITFLFTLYPIILSHRSCICLC